MADLKKIMKKKEKTELKMVVNINIIGMKKIKMENGKKVFLKHIKLNQMQ